MRGAGLVLTFAAAVLLAGAGPEAQTPGPTPVPDVQRLGPQAGERVPGFTLSDQFGQPRTLASLMGPKGLMLVFTRSADWCPYCKTQLADLQARRPEISAAGLGVAAISYDSVPTLREFSNRRGITFPLLSDAGSDVIRRYGLFNTTIPETNRASYGIPFPGTFIVDRDGLVRSRMFEPAYQERVTVATMLMRNGTDLAVPVTTRSTPQLRLTTFATEAIVAPGAVFALVVDGVPGPGMHVYAPGAQGYTALALDIEPQPGVRVRPSTYPRSETYHFKPLDERVPVYRRPFRVVAEVLLDAMPGAAPIAAGTVVTIHGTLRSQACSDTTCFNPQAVPMTWQVTTRALDRERGSSPPR